MLYGGRKRGRKSNRQILVLREAGVSIEELASRFSTKPPRIRQILSEERRRRATEQELQQYMRVRGLGDSFGFVDGHSQEVENGV